MPADNEQRVSLARCRGRNAGSHVSPQPSGRRGYSARVAQPCRIQPSRGSASESGGRCWQSHQVPPGHFSWCCWRQDKQIIALLFLAAYAPQARPPFSPAADAPAGPATILLRAADPDTRGLARQAAFARRIRRRRSADRSSSFNPPHVPYFSGRLTA